MAKDHASASFLESAVSSIDESDENICEKEGHATVEKQCNPLELTENYIGSCSDKDNSIIKALQIQMNNMEEKLKTLVSESNQKDRHIINLKESKEQWTWKALLPKESLLNVSIIRDSVENCSFYTGFPNYGTFKSLVDHFEANASKLQCWYETNRNEEHRRGNSRQLTVEEDFFLVMLRLRLGMPLKELARVFSLSESSVSYIITTWIEFLYHELKDMFPFPSKEATAIARPPSFHEYLNTRIIIDFTEFKMEKPNISASHKNYIRLKALIGISPGGMVTFVSKVYSGAQSDKFIVQDCGVLHILQPPDDCMANKSFDIRPSKVSRLSPEDVTKTKSIAKVLEHKEGAIGRLKSYHIFDSPIPILMVGVTEHLVTVCALLTNFLPALIKDN